MHCLGMLLLLLNAAFQPSPPQLELKDVQGNLHSLYNYRGHIVVLNFWATWCVACKTEMPIFVEANKKYHDRGVVILAASVDDESTRRYVSQYARVYKMEFTILMDASTAIMRELGLGDGLPSTVFFDADGNIAGRILGQAQKKDVQRRIEWLLGNQQGQPPHSLVDNFSRK